MHFTRRTFMGTAAAAAIAAPVGRARAAAKYKRCLVTTPEGQKALASYAKGVRAMLTLPPDHPHNWFRNAFIHLMDCPHGNWWFYVWHRGYLGYLEQTIRSLSGDETFALPYWDWSQLPQIPDGMFDSVLTPTDAAYAPYTETLDVFTRYFKPSFAKFWETLNDAQRQQLILRGYPQLDNLWNDVTGNGVPGNESFAVTSGARYLSRANPKLDPGTTIAVSKNTVLGGLLAPKFNDPNGALSFTSSKSDSHTAAPSGAPVFSVLEGQPHNLVHNCIGGVRPDYSGPYGNMTNFLSPVDPIFFLHHANMDRLWDVWVRKQQSLDLPILPSGTDMQNFAAEPFLFFVDVQGKAVLDGKAGDYLSTDRFDYDYDRAGFGENLIASGPAALVAESAPMSAPARANEAKVTLPEAVRSAGADAAAPRPVVALITLDRSAAQSDTREFRVLLGGDGSSGSGDGQFAGKVGFFGPQMANMHMGHETTFAVVLPPSHPVLTDRMAAGPEKAAPTDLVVRVVPANGGTEAPDVLRSVAIGRL